MRVLGLVTDLIFGVKIGSTANALQVPYQGIRSVEALEKQLTAGDVGLLIVDLNATGVDPIAIVQAAKAKAPTVRVLAFLSHVQVELAEAAKAAGADEVLPRSAFSARLPQILQATQQGG